MSYLSRVRRGQSERPVERNALAQLFNDLAVNFSYNGIGYTAPVLQTATRRTYELPSTEYDQMVDRVFKGSGVVFGAVLARALLLSETEFKFQNLATRELFGSPALVPLEQPETNKTTGELLMRAEMDVSIVGNWFLAHDADTGRLLRLNPAYTSIQISSESDPDNPDEAWDTKVDGYWYAPPKARARFFMPEEVVHWSPVPDPRARFRGMSWMTPILWDILGDQAITEHKVSFMANGATPNLVVKFPETLVDPEQFNAIREAMSEAEGVSNAGKTLYLMAGADATVVGATLKDLDLKAVQSVFENRVSVASRMHAVVLGTSEGMQGSSLNAGNFSEAKKSVSQTWYHPTVKSLCSALSGLVDVPTGSRLWFDPKAVALLSEDVQDEAETAMKDASTARTLVEAGFDPNTVTAYLISRDPRDLKHTGNLSVQLQPPGSSESQQGDTQPTEVSNG